MDAFPKTDNEFSPWMGVFMDIQIFMEQEVHLKSTRWLIRFSLSTSLIPPPCITFTLDH